MRASPPIERPDAEPRRRHDLDPRWAVLAGVGLNLLLVYPGMMMWDSIDQLLQARAGKLNDWHPPVMGFIWRWLDEVAAGPFPMLALQLCLGWAGAWLVVRAAGTRPTVGRIAVLWSALLFPPVACVMGFIVKDALLAGVLLFAFGFVPVVRTWRDGGARGRFTAGVAVLGGCLVLAAALRYNAIGAVWITSAFAIHSLAARPPRLVRSLGLGLVAAVGCAGLATRMNALLTDVPEHPWKSVAAYDIAGVARELGSVDFITADDQVALAGDTPGGEWTLERLKKGRRDWNHMLAAGLNVQPSPTLKRVWRQSIRRHPGAYLAHRLESFAANLGFSGDAVSQCVQLEPLTGFGDRDAAGVATLLRHDYKLTAVQRGLRDTTVWLARRTCLFWPGLYLALGAGIALWSIRDVTRGAALPFFLAASGLAQEATLVFLAPAVNYRYSHWLVISAWLSFLLVAVPAGTAVVARWRNGRSTTGTTP